MKTDTHFWSYYAQGFLESEMLRTKLVEEIKTHVLCSKTFFFPENRAVYETKWKNTVQPGRPQMTILMRIACWIPKDTHTLRICNNYCFYTVTVVARTRPNVTLYAHCLSCYNLTYLSTLSSLCPTNCILTHSTIPSISLLPNFHVSGCQSAIRDSILAIHLVPWTKSGTSISLSHKAPCLYYFLYQVPTLLLRLLCTLGFLWPSYKIFPSMLPIISHPRFTVMTSSTLTTTSRSLV